DDERGSAREQESECALDLPLRPDVDRRRRLVEDEDPRVGEQRTRERDELALAEREARAALLQLRLVPVLEAEDELVRTNGLRGADDVLGCGIGTRERDVLGDSAGEEESFLRDDSELVAQRLLRHVAQVHVV